MKTTDFAKYLTAYFTEYLIGERGVSPNTIRSYSESFSLLLNFLDERVNIKADNLRLEHITRKTVLSFLDWLQDTKQSSNATRNQRLAASRRPQEQLRLAPGSPRACRKGWHALPGLWRSSWSRQA